MGGGREGEEGEVGVGKEGGGGGEEGGWVGEEEVWEAKRRLGRREEVGEAGRGVGEAKKGSGTDPCKKCQSDTEIEASDRHTTVAATVI